MSKLVPLSFLEPGDTAEIVEIRAGKGLITRLANMGFFPGVKITVISNPRRGPVIVAKGNIRLGIGFGMASKIFVRRLR